MPKSFNQKLKPKRKHFFLEMENNIFFFTLIGFLNIFVNFIFILWREYLNLEYLNSKY